MNETLKPLKAAKAGKASMARPVRKESESRSVTDEHKLINADSLHINGIEFYFNIKVALIGVCWPS